MINQKLMENRRFYEVTHFQGKPNLTGLNVQDLVSLPDAFVKTFSNKIMNKDKS